MLFWFGPIFGFTFQNPFQHGAAFGYLTVVNVYVQKNEFWRFCNVIQIFLIFTFPLKRKKTRYKPISHIVLGAKLG